MIFDHLRVLELASVLAGPSAGQFFAELGAEVIKVENLTTQGDVTRSWKVAGEKGGDLSAYFCSVNWGKKSMAIDLSSEHGRNIIHQLASTTDVVITSYKPGDARKLGVDYQQLSRINPKLVYGQITGYGSFNDRVGYDAIIQAESGFIDMNGEAGGSPVKLPVALMDVLAGHQLKEGLLLALLNKERTGSGSLVEVSLLQSALASLVNQASNWLVANALPRRQGSAHPNIAPYGESFLTRDGKLILLAVGTNKQYKDLCSVLDLNELIDDERYKSNERRVENRESLKNSIGEKMLNWESDDLMIKLNKMKIPAGLVQNVREALDMPEAKELLVSVDGLKGVRSYVGSGEKSGLTSPPHYGEHTKQVLMSMGYGEEEIHLYLADSVVYQPVQ